MKGESMKNKIYGLNKSSKEELINMSKSLKSLEDFQERALKYISNLEKRVRELEKKPQKVDAIGITLTPTPSNTYIKIPIDIFEVKGTTWPGSWFKKF